MQHDATMASLASDGTKKEMPHQEPEKEYIIPERPGETIAIREKTRRSDVAASGKEEARWCKSNEDMEIQNNHGKLK